MVLDKFQCVCCDLRAAKAPSLHVAQYHKAFFDRARRSSLACVLGAAMKVRQCLVGGSRICIQGIHGGLIPYKVDNASISNFSIAGCQSDAALGRPRQNYSFDCSALHSHTHQAYFSKEDQLDLNGSVVTLRVSASQHTLQLFDAVNRAGTGLNHQTKIYRLASPDHERT